MGNATATDRRYSAGGYYDLVNPSLLAKIRSEHRRILEVGCGAAGLGAQCKRVDPDREVWGLELDAEAASIAADRIDRVLVTDLDALDTLPGDAGRFDLVTYGDVLEHLRDPGRLLDVLGAHLAVSGEILVSIPNVGHWSVVQQLLAGTFRYEDAGLLDRTHIRFFTPATFHALLDEHGYVVTDETRVVQPGPVTDVYAKVAAVTAGRGETDPARVKLDLNTYQTVYVARPRVTRPLAALVGCTGALDARVARTVTTYLDTFRSPEPVLLVVAAPVDANDLGAASRLMAEVTALVEDHRVPAPQQANVVLHLYNSRDDVRAEIATLVEETVPGAGLVATDPPSARPPGFADVTSVEPTSRGLLTAARG